MATRPVSSVAVRELEGAKTLRGLAVGDDADHVAFGVGEHADLERVAQLVGPKIRFPPSVCARVSVVATSVTET
jgi:hypothetical protein